MTRKGREGTLGRMAAPPQGGLLPEHRVPVCPGAVFTAEVESLKR